MSEYSTQTQGTTAVLSISGRFTAESHKGFKDAAYPLVDNPAITAISLDLAAVSYMDSSSLGILLLLREKAAAKGKNLSLRNPNPTVLPVLKMVRFDKLFETTSN